MGYMDKSGSSFAVNGLNAIFRMLQLGFAAVVVGIYAEAKSHAMWANSFEGRYLKELHVAIAAGVLSILTAVGFGVLPFLISYYYVAVAFLWDWIVFFVWCAVFAVEHKIFGDRKMTSLMKDWDLPSIDALIAGQWFALGAMLTVLMSAVMGPVCLFMDRTSLRAPRATV